MLPRIGWASPIDAGDPQSPAGSVHSRIKRPVGTRLGDSALAIVYGQQVAWGGPRAQAVVRAPILSPTFAGPTPFVVNLATGTSLQDARDVRCPIAEGVPGNLCAGFTATGSDGKTYNATGTITGDRASLTITPHRMPVGVQPTAVQYAYSIWPLVSLYDASGLPVTPFNITISKAAAVNPQPLRVYVDCKRALNLSEADLHPPDGSLASPFWSLNGARDFIRLLLRPLAQPVAVLILPGDCYPRTAKGVLDFTQPVLSLNDPVRDSGSPDAPIVYQPYSGGGTARLLGGLKLDNGLWRPRQLAAPTPAADGAYTAGSQVTAFSMNLTEAVVAAGGNAATLTAVGFGLASGILCASGANADLFFGGRPMVLARYPNMRLDGLNNFIFVQDVGKDPQGRRVVSTASSRPIRQNWANESSPQLQGYWFADWSDAIHNVLPNATKLGASNASIPGYDGDVGTQFTLDVPANYPYPNGFTPKAKFFGLNLLAEMDAPGELCRNPCI
jgi:hypothetical protein